MDAVFSNISLYLVLFFIVFIVVVLVIWVILYNKAYKKHVKEAEEYIESHKKELFDKCMPLSQECVDLYNTISRGIIKYIKNIDSLGLNRICQCSSSVISKLDSDPVQYIIKYSNIDYSEESLAKIDFCIKLMKLSSVLTSKKADLERKLRAQLPENVKKYGSTSNLASRVCGITTNFAKESQPYLGFSYVSPAGRSSKDCNVFITIEHLEEIKEQIRISNGASHQRSAMTNELRERIKKRDNYTCCICGNSIYNEPNLLLEIDHIIPISKGGKTEESNLQTLCWKCNRSKSAKIVKNKMDN